MSERLLPPEQRIIRRLTKKGEPATAQAFLTAARKMLGSIDFESLVEAVGTIKPEQSVFALRKALRYQKVILQTFIGEFEVRLGPLVKRLLANAGQVGLPVFTETIGIQLLDFETFERLAVGVARELVAEAVTAVTDGTRAAIRGVVARGFEEGIAPAATARRLMDTVGLDDRRARGFETWLKELRENPPDKSAEQIQRMIDREYTRRLKSRAMAIARTENANVAAATQNTIWNTAIEEGRIRETTYVRVWARIPAAKPCPICGPLNRKRARVKGGYYVGAGGKRYYRPPGHTSCRCGEFLDRWQEGDEFLPVEEEAEAAA